MHEWVDPNIPAWHLYMCTLPSQPQLLQNDHGNQVLARYTDSVHTDYTASRIRLDHPDWRPKCDRYLSDMTS